MKVKPKLISDDYEPSDNLLKWCSQMGITANFVNDQKVDFIFWHKEKKQKRSYFDIAFKNWLKKALTFDKRHEDVIRKGHQSFGSYAPLEKSLQSKCVGRAALDALLGKTNEKSE